MKKLLKITTVLLVLCMAFNLIACSSYPRVKSALEEVGYTAIENEENDVSKEAEENESVVKIYLLTNKDSLSALEVYKITLVTVIEFNSTKELVEYYKESNTLQGIVADVQEDGTAEEVYNELKTKGLACGNCIIAPIGLDANTVINAIKELNK